MINHPTNGTFSERLRYLLGGRGVDPWAKRMRIPGGTRARMLAGDGIPPTYETLARIMRVENVSLSWLLGADTAPFLVARTVDDAETADRLRALLEDEAGWRIVVLVDGSQAALMLHQPAAIDHPKGAIDYTAVELIAGPFGERTFAVLQELRDGKVQKVVRVAERFIRDLYAGEVGSFLLIGGGKHHGAVDIAGDTDIDLNEAIDNLTRHRLRVAEGTAIAGSDIPTPLVPLARWWPLLADAERDAITTLLDPFLSNAAHRLQKR